MATFLETGLLNYFSIIFPALLVFVLVFALLQKIKILGDNKTINALVAIALGFIVLLSESILSIINFAAPWFVVFFIFMVLLLVVFKLMGASDENIASVVRSDKVVQWAIIAISVIIIASALGNVYGQKLLPFTTEEVNVTENGEVTSTATTSYSTNVAAVLFNPKVLGLVFLLLVAAFTIALITKEAV
ncbi:hypothetical protein KY343_02720 [Candidatus Woesearchaeota archaeon]|nr:hypothetical protein [Candidatus Woesearchaeota archaeon]